ncbi:DUF6988 family protein [Aeromonas veronii]|uniref:DUF6988 family protein n=1 Tax=Aeromonas veronii TaxID=654 RepID=UPI001F42CCCA|nr:hypothetical protein [Aeromonas veronii]MCF5850296.1 hypothetical protein [Aeromonas veronii]
MDIFTQSTKLSEELYKVINCPLCDNSARVVISDVACSLSLEHWHSIRITLELGYLPSALVVHRSQFESIVRSIWLLYSASDAQLAKLSVELTLESEQEAKNIPQMSLMMDALAKDAPIEAFKALSRFKDHSWKALNSYVHAGIHPIRRHSEGYPVKLIHDVLKNANGLAILACMQSVVLSGRLPLQREILKLAEKRAICMPPILNNL